jgi:hypothetical protein
MVMLKCRMDLPERQVALMLAADFFRARSMRQWFEGHFNDVIFAIGQVGGPDGSVGGPDRGQHAYQADEDAHEHDQE